MAREASSSKIFSVSSSGNFHAFEALAELNGRTGNLETKSASRSENNSFKIWLCFR